MALPGLQSQGISIHALREEGDPQADRPVQGPRHFYPRPPRGGRRVKPGASRQSRQFLSTPSARRATGFWDARVYFNGISIHALREEGDPRGRKG